MSTSIIQLILFFILVGRYQARFVKCYHKLGTKPEMQNVKTAETELMTTLNSRKTAKQMLIVLRPGTSSQT
jgi:hypothetical protein